MPSGRAQVNFSSRPLPARGAMGSVSHRVENVVHAQADREIRKSLWVVGVIRPFPGISHVRVVADRYQNAAPVIINGAPMRALPGRAILVAGAQVRLARKLVLLSQIVNIVEDGVVVGDFADWIFRQDFVDPGFELAP